MGAARLLALALYPFQAPAVAGVFLMVALRGPIGVRLRRHSMPGTVGVLLGTLIVSTILL